MQIAQRVTTHNQDKLIYNATLAQPTRTALLSPQRLAQSVQLVLLQPIQFLAHLRAPP